MGGGAGEKRIKGEMWGEEFGREVEREDWMGVKEQGRVGRLGRIGEIGGGGGGRQVMISFGGEGVREGGGEKGGERGEEGVEGGEKKGEGGEWSEGEEGGEGEGEGGGFNFLHQVACLFDLWAPHLNLVLEGRKSSSSRSGVSQLSKDRGGEGGFLKEGGEDMRWGTTVVHFISMHNRDISG